MRVLVLGSRGQLGSAITRHLKDRHHRVLTPTHTELDIEAPRVVTEYLREEHPELVINCAAFHDAKMCEKNPVGASSVNVRAVEYLSRTCLELGGIKLYHLSTDQVLKVPPNLQDEDAFTFTYDVHSQTKREGELSLQEPHTAIRVSSPYGHDLCRGKDRLSFVEQIIQAIGEEKELSLPNNVGCSPCYAEDIGRIITELVDKDLPRIVHLAPEGLDGTYSWYDFARDIAHIYGSDWEPQQRQADQGRSTGLVNMTSKYGWVLPTVKASLAVYIKKRGKSEVPHSEPTTTE